MTNYFNMSKEEKVEFEKSMRSMPDVYYEAVQILEFPKLYLDKNIYEPLGGTLGLHWRESSNLEADTESWPGKKIDHRINISYPMVEAMWRDSLSFCLYAKNLFGIDSESEMTDIFELYQSKGRILDAETGVLPAGTSLNYCVGMINGLGMTWLFKHEASHLLQNHGLIRAKAKELSVTDGQPLGVSEFGSFKNLKPTDEKESWVWHVTELAADYEATVSAITTMKLQNELAALQGIAEKDNIAWKDIWLLFVAISLNFFRFWEASKTPFSAVASGSHPHPGIRYYLAVEAVYANLKESKDALGIELSSEQMLEIANDAFVSAVMFWVYRHEAVEEMKKDFLEVALGNAPGVASYLAKADEVWGSIKPEATENHLSKDNKVILNLNTSFIQKNAAQSGHP